MASLSHGIDHFLVRETVVGLHGEREDLPKDDSKRPHVAEDGGLSVENRLRRHPAHGQESRSADAIVIHAIDVLTHAEVGDFDDKAFGDETIARRQVAMNVATMSEIAHPGGNLSCNLYELFDGQRRFLRQRVGQRATLTVSAADRVVVIALPMIIPRVVEQIFIEIAERHVLEEKIDGSHAVRADAEKTNDVRMIEIAH